MSRLSEYQELQHQGLLALLREKEWVFDEFWLRFRCLFCGGGRPRRANLYAEQEGHLPGCRLAALLKD